MRKIMREPWIKLKDYLNREEYAAIRALETECLQNERISLKLELDYKLKDAANASQPRAVRGINEFLYYDGSLLIGYLGICGFGGTAMPLEMTGMVHPAYRRQGVFTKLHELAMAENVRRRATAALLLCDRNAEAGQAWLQKRGAQCRHTEYEMVRGEDAPAIREEQFLELRFRKASNADAKEIARQNSLFFGENEAEDTDGPLPEDEEKRGMMIYLAYLGDRIIGKTNLELIDAKGGIYGLGVLQQYRGKGFGRAILLQSVAKLQAERAGEIRLQVSATNATALGLYRSSGFVETAVMDYFALPCVPAGTKAV